MQAGKKILVSGGGRCNITNRFISAQNYVGDANFVNNTLKTLGFRDVLDFFNELKFKEQKDAQFFCENSAKGVLNALLCRVGSRLKCGVRITSACKNSEVFELTNQDGKKFNCKNLVLATGGMSYKSLGANDIGIQIAQKFGLKAINFTPALVGFSVQKSEFWFKNLSGVSLRASVEIADKKFENDVLFTHRGISGPAILNASLFWQKGHLRINFLLKFKQSNLIQGKKQLSSVLPLPKRFTTQFLNSLGLKDAPFASYNEQQKEQILKLFNYEFAPAGTFGFERAEVSRGGVCVSQLDENFESKKVRGLYVIGELSEVTGILGGYNIHFAFASAKKLSQKLNKG